MKSLFASVCLLLSAAGAAHASSVYVGKVWPYKVVRAGERLEYSYDLTVVKSGPGSADVRAEVGEEALKAFLKSLPKEVKASAQIDGAVVALSAVPNLEKAALSASFSSSSAMAMAASSPIAKDPGARALPPLHADSPKVLPSLDLVLWKARSVEEGALVAIELAAESGSLGLPMGRKDFWQKILDKALARMRSEQGDGKDGAIALAARLGAARCSDPANLPAALRATPELAKAVSDEITGLRAVQSRLVPHGPWLWTSELRCMYLRDRVLAEAMPTSRGGAAGVLTFMAILDGDPKLAKAYAALEGLRDALHGRPGGDQMPQYRAASARDSAEAAIDDLPGFFERLSSSGSDPHAPRPPLFAEAETPITQFLAGLNAAERSNALEELALAIQDGRVPLNADATGPWAIFRDAALVPLLRPEAAGGLSGSLIVDAAYRSRLEASFQALRGAHREGSDEAADDEAPEEGGRPELKVQLMVPPHLEAEPLPAAYARSAASLGRLEAYLGANPKAASLSGALPEGGRRSGTLRAEVAQTRSLLRGLELLSAGVAGPGAKASWSAEDTKAVAQARKLIAGWRSDADLTRDARAIEGFAEQDSGSLAFSGIFGVGRREVRANFSHLPKVKIATYPDGSGPFVADASAAQKYILPVLATGAAGPVRGAETTPKFWGEVAAPDRARFKALCEKAGRLRDAIEGALPEALSAAP